MKLLLENLPPSMEPHRDAIRRCILAFHKTMPLERVILFGSHARGDARPDSDVDLCIVAKGAERQFDAAAAFRRALWEVRPWPPLTLIPITPARLAEKERSQDHFFKTVLNEGVPLAQEN